ncbi:MAG TPA: ABC transporter permease [Ktedonobacter sp.]|nr:ABC transporter permease [Ktedonobacter sp.]HAT44675.1 ABC transporter permease [Ktedonobacter sp.]HBE26991.1 ABC transporter permease [Ktedonobacter sp.]HBE27864.1 ABC transporter permease [Ktedonobacter sp.]HCF88163.1 ABC transporter permease [Ktedonobacter sp.]
MLLRVVLSTDLWQSTLQFGALLLLPALGGVISERSGVVNIAMEGMMLTGAYAGVMTALATHSVLGGVLGAIIAGGLMSLVHAIVSINFKANQIVSGIAINIAALGLTNYLLFIQTGGQGVPSLTNALRLPILSLGPLVSIPFLGPILFQQNVIFYVAILILAGIQFLLFRTNIGLRIRAVGEHPQAADTAGVNVRLVRYCCVIGSGLLSGLAGAFLSLGIAGIFNSNMTAGAGFIALAAMVFGKYKPWNTAGACLIFGLGEALSVRLQDTGVSPNLLSTLPYVLTLIALVGLVGRTIPPAADGIPYEPGTE